MGQQEMQIKNPARGGVLYLIWRGWEDYSGLWPSPLRGRRRFAPAFLNLLRGFRSNLLSVQILSDSEICK
jgi:hypothetical protein